MTTQTDLLTVTEGGNTYQQILSGGYAANAFSAGRDSVGGTLITMTGGSPPPPPVSRTLQWNGSLNGNFTNAMCWVDITNGLDPAQLAPTSIDTAQLLSGVARLPAAARSRHYSSAAVHSGTWPPAPPWRPSPRLRSARRVSTGC